MARFLIVASLLMAILTTATMRAPAQVSGKVYRLAVLATDEFQPGFLLPPATLTELARHGFIGGRNLKIEPHVGPPERLLELAWEMVQTRPDIIYAAGTLPARAASSASKTIPLIGLAFDFEDRLVASLARPGGNLTGVTNLTSELEMKRLAILRELVPEARVMALLRDPPETSVEQIAGLKAASHDLGLAVEVVEARQPDEIADALRRARVAGAAGVNVLASAMFFQKVGVLAEAAIAARLPAICFMRAMAEAGCVATYSPTTDMYRTVGKQIALVLQGASVADLPVEQPTKFELILNLKAARALGLSVPPSLLAQADEVIE